MSSLVLSAGTLSPAFASTTTGYSAVVSTGTSSITVTPTAALGGSTITVNGTPVASGAASGSIALSFGGTTITVFVTAPNGIQTKTYTVTVYRPWFVSTNADSGAGSLRQAIADANANPGADVLTFAPALGGQTITLTTGALVVSDGAGVVIDGSTLAGGLTINGNGADRVFFVNGGGLTLVSLTITGGFCVAGNGGGGILNDGAVVLERCTLTGNSGGYGAALFNQPSRPATLRHCTLAANTAVNTGGAIYNLGTVVLTHCTVAGNSASTNDFAMLRCGGIHNVSAQLTLENSLVAGNTATSVNDVATSGALTRAGANIVQTPISNQGIINGAGTVSQVDPLLAPLASYGGPTQTRALLPASPARNAATGSTATSDQRGFPIVVTPDIGAYEAGTFTDFDAWSWETLPATATPAQHAPTFDYDSDGRPLLLEYAGQFSATTPEFGNPVGFTRNAAGTLATLVIPYRPGATDLLYTIERSANLTGAWTPVITVNSATNTYNLLVPGVAFATSNSTSMTFTDAFIAGQPQVFYRLKITQQ